MTNLTKTKKLKEHMIREKCAQCGKLLKRIEPYTYVCKCRPDLRIAYL